MSPAVQARFTAAQLGDFQPPSPGLEDFQPAKECLSLSHLLACGGPVLPTLSIWVLGKRRYKVHKAVCLGVCFSPAEVLC